MHSLEFKEKFVGDSHDVGGEGCTCVEEGSWEINHKMEYKTSVYAIGDEYFAVDFSRDNSGYWSDGEVYEPTVRKVAPKTETKVVVVWKDVKE